MTLITAMRQWLKTYPPLAGGRLNVDFLPTEAESYSVEAVPVAEVLRKYLDGSTVRQFAFVLASREFYSENIAQNTDNLEFYEELSHWVAQQKRKLPDLGEGRKAAKIEILSPGYMFYGDDQGTARYQIQMKLTYNQKGTR